MKHIFEIKTIFFILILSLIATHTYGQVTLGIGEAPVYGALLQLKEKNEADGKSAGYVNSSRGLGLPRVALRERNKLFPMFDGNASYTNDSAYKGEEDAKHKGLLVYNISTAPPSSVVWDDLKPGVFVWDGQYWEPVGNYNSSGIETVVAKPIIGATINNGCAPTFYGGAILTITNLSSYTNASSLTFYWTVISGGASYTTSGTYQEFCTLTFSSNETVTVVVTVEKDGKFNVSDSFVLNTVVDKASSSYYISSNAPAKFCYDINASTPSGCTSTDRIQEITTGTQYKYQISGSNITSVKWTCSDPNALVKSFVDDANNSTCTVTFDYNDLISSNKGIKGNITGKTFTLHAAIVTSAVNNPSCQAVYNISREVKIKDCKCCPSTMTDMSGYSYDVGDFGTAGCWTLQNMHATAYYRGSGISNGTLTKLANPSTAEPSGFSYAIPNAENNTDGTLYGYLYPARTANAICNSKDQGFTLPTGLQLQALEQEISGNPEKYTLYNPYTFEWSGTTYPTSDFYKKYGAGYSMRSWDTSYAYNGASKSAKDGGFDFRTNGGFTLNNLYYNTGAALWVSDSFTNGTPSSGRLFMYLDNSAIPTIYPNTYGKAYVRCVKQ